jgi:hypothetical protein
MEHVWSLDLGRWDCAGSWDGGKHGFVRTLSAVSVCDRGGGRNMLTSPRRVAVDTPFRLSKSG